MLASIFGRRITPISSIDFYTFIDFIPESLFIKEIIEIFKMPLQKLKTRSNTCFTPIDMTSPDNAKIIEMLKLATQERFL